ncbi:MAG: DUF881 domain-containing protein [Candidatus Gastranaerophilales bacterium]|nr:DUF881 domain-containing protein [Candidatus Gastranaerophilales bacterium]
MNYKESFKDNKPLLSIDVMPFFKNFYTDKRVFLTSVGIFLVIIVISVTYMIIENNKTTNKILIARESMLNSELVKMENANDILEAEVLLLKNDVKSLSKKRDRKKLAKISKYIADTELQGKGVEIILKDNNFDNEVTNEENAIIHNTDLLRIVNFLWENGAEGISINDERIAPNTYISCVGATILINKKRITSPFKIRVIGKNFSKNTVENSSVVLSLKLRGIEYQTTEKEEILLPPNKYSSSKE